MAETIVCPKCQYEIEVTEVMSSQLRAELKHEFDEALRIKENEFSGREAKLAEQQHKLALERTAIDEEIATRVNKEREQLGKLALQKAKEEVAVDLKSAAMELAEIR